MWLVVGAGVSGLGAAKLLRKKGFPVRVSEGSKLAEERALPFRDLGCEILDGGHEPRHLDGVIGVVPSPGMPPSHLLLAAAKERGIPIVSEIDLALREFRGRVIGVTGTNGKSTTTAMLGHLLNRAGVATTIGGNFGDPPTAQWAEGRLRDVLVLELSSYQLEQASGIHADCAIMTSFTPDHIGRHGTLEAYFEAKWTLFAKLLASGRAILPVKAFERAKAQGLSLFAKDLWLHDQERVSREGMRFRLDQTVLHRQGEAPLDLAATGIETPHDLLNASYALLAAEHVTGRPAKELLPALSGFKGLPHRLEPVAAEGRRVLNDSKATNVDSVLVALAAQKSPVWLWLGGRGKGESFAPLANEKDRIKGIIAFGESGTQIERELGGTLTVKRFSTLGEALSRLSELWAEYPGDWLFSPGCASFDEFKNFEERGEVFKQAVLALTGGKS